MASSKTARQVSAQHISAHLGSSRFISTDLGSSRAISGHLSASRAAAAGRAATARAAAARVAARQRRRKQWRRRRRRRREGGGGGGEGVATRVTGGATGLVDGRRRPTTAPHAAETLPRATAGCAATAAARLVAVDLASPLGAGLYTRPRLGSRPGERRTAAGDLPRRRTPQRRRRETPPAAQRLPPRGSRRWT